MKYRLLFEDNFEIDGRPNPDIWVNEVGGHGFGNNELQFYTDSEKNAYVKNGMLHMVAMKEECENRNYTSSKLITYKKHSIKYGKIEIEAKLPKGVGTWPAFWMLPDSIKEGTPWPLCGEIDIMEHVGKNQDMIHFSLHTEKYNFLKDAQFTKFLRVEEVSDSFYTYGMEWTEDYISFSIDGMQLAKFRKGDREDVSETGWPFDQPFYLILNLAVGGNWGGPVDDESLPWVMNVKSVKVYNKI